MTEVVATQNPTEALTREVYLALMWSLSYPGCAHHLPASSWHDFVVIGRTLLDLETSFYCADPHLADRLAHTGARVHAVANAAYVFLPQLDRATVSLIERVNVGTVIYPDESATLIIGCQFDAQGRIMTWSGPGMPAPRRVMLGGVPDAFWTIRQEMMRYPLGFDVFFVHQGQVMGLPRTTKVEMN